MHLISSKRTHLQSHAANSLPTDLASLHLTVNSPQSRRVTPPYRPVARVGRKKPGTGDFLPQPSRRQGFENIKKYATGLGGGGYCLGNSFKKWNFITPLPLEFGPTYHLNYSPM